KVAVEVGSGIKCLAEGIAGQNREVRAESLLDLENRTFIEGRTQGRILISLQQQRVGKTSHDGRIGARIPQRAVRRVEVMQLNDRAIGQLDRSERRSRESVDINRDWQSDGMDVDAAERNRPSFCDFPLNTKLSLLRIRAAIAGLTAENNAQ